MLIDGGLAAGILDADPAIPAPSRRRPGSWSTPPALSLDISVRTRRPKGPSMDDASRRKSYLRGDSHESIAVSESTGG
jgi:hypothetical protein